MEQEVLKAKGWGTGDLEENTYSSLAHQSPGVLVEYGRGRENTSPFTQRDLMQMFRLLTLVVGS